MHLNVVFRVDSSALIGTGHVIRCLTLADELRRNGEVKAIFICRLHPGNISRLIEQRGYTVVGLQIPASLPQNTLTGAAYASWLGVSWECDVNDSINAIDAYGMQPDWFITDHYGIDAKWENSLRMRLPKTRVLAIDDLADRPHDCHALLDQNLAADPYSRYEDLLPRNCFKMLGPDHALLQPIYAEFHRQAMPRKGRIKRVLFYFGGADQENMTGLALKAWLASGVKNIHADVVLPLAGLHTPALHRLAQGRENITLHAPQPSLAWLMLKADLCLGGGGATSWERLCLGLPSLVITMADNQVPISRTLQERGLIQLLGTSESIDKYTIIDSIQRITCQELDPVWSINCMRTVDGLGARRVCSTLLTHEELL